MILATPLKWMCASTDKHDLVQVARGFPLWHLYGRFNCHVCLVPGRFAERGYRFVHVVRDPMEMIIRSYIAAHRNATLTLNATSLLASVDSDIRTRLAEELHSMQAISESHEADPHYLRLRVEDLEDANVSQRSSTLVNMFNFLLNGSPYGMRMASFPPSIGIVLDQARTSEEQEGSQRRYLAALLQHKPAKCHHVGRLQAALRYPIMACQK